MNQPTVHFEKEPSTDPETEAILKEARQVVMDQFPEWKQECETHFTAISKAASNVRSKFIILAVISFYKNLIGRSSPSETFQLN